MVLCCPKRLLLILWSALMAAMLAACAPDAGNEAASAAKTGSHDQAQNSDKEKAEQDTYRNFSSGFHEPREGESK